MRQPRPLSPPRRHRRAAARHRVPRLSVSDADGAYRFRTIKPVPYPGRTPHIHFAIQAPGGRELVTQMYVAGEPLNARDGLYQAIRDPRQRAAVTVRLEPANGIEAGALAGQFDITLA